MESLFLPTLDEKLIPIREELEAGALGKLTGNGIYSVGGSLVVGTLLMLAGPRPLILQH